MIQIPLAISKVAFLFSMIENIKEESFEIYSDKLPYYRSVSVIAYHSINCPELLTLKLNLRLADFQCNE